MNKLLSHIPFRDLLAHSIKTDPTVAAAAQSLDGLLNRTSLAIPNLLLWARLDREKARLTAPLTRVTEAAGGLKAHSGNALELLAWQLHVDFREVAKNDQELEAMVLGSIPWHRLKGTPAAVEQGLAWFGIKAITDESGSGRNWAVYELELVEVPSDRDLANIVRVAEEAGPKRSWLRRVHDKYDLRPIILDVGPVLGEGLLSDDSGIWHPDLGVKESFGREASLGSEPYSRGWAGLAREDTRPGRIFYLDKFILDVSRLGDRYVGSHGFVVSELWSMQSLGIDGRRYFWLGPWDARKWADGFSAPRRLIHHRREVSKSQLVLGESRLGWPTKKTDRRRVVLVDHPPRLGDHRLSVSDLGYRAPYLDQYFLRRKSLTLEPASVHQPWLNVGDTRGLIGLRAADPPRITVTHSYDDYRALLAPGAGAGWLGPWSGYWRRQALINSSQGD